MMRWFTYASALASGLILLIGGTTGLRAQTFDEAVRANVALAVDLCNRPGVTNDLRVQLFRSAGFAEQVTRSTTNSDTTHVFTAPADTVSVEFYYGEGPEYCAATTAHLGVTEASAILDAMVPRLYPGFARNVSFGPADPATGQPAQCVQYLDPISPIGLAIGVVAGGGAQGCTGNGTSIIFSSYRV